MELTDSLLRWLNAAVRGAKAQKPLIGLDFDGTLVPHHSDPKAVFLPTATRQILLELTQRYDCAVISGRMLADLRNRVPAGSMHLVGNHGCEIEKKDGRSWRWQSKEWKEWRDRRLTQISQLVAANCGRLEDKEYSLALHYRGVPDDTWWTDEAPAILSGLVGGAALLMSGTLCWNIVPVGAPHKGDAVAKLCREEGYDAAVYFGDEATDENVFRMTGMPLFTVKIGPGETAARARLSGPEELSTLLKSLIVSA